MIKGRAGSSFGIGCAYPGSKGTADLSLRSGPATDFYGTVALSFVIPSEAEGSAVQRTFTGNAEFYPQTKIVISTGA
jgi:hypothetical protein